MNRPVKEPLRILAPNPSPLTGPGTTTFLLGRDQVAVIDPGPDDPAHIEAVARAGRDRIGHILITHAHRDHSAGAARLSRLTGAPVLAFGTATEGRSPVMQRLAAGGLLCGGEGLDHDFAPDRRLRDGDIIKTPEWRLIAMHMPGHAAGHMCFGWDDTVFCGDLVMGWSSTLISPPDGDLGDYFRSLDRLGQTGASRLLPTHGDPIENPAPRLAELARHRRERSRQIIAALRERGDSAQGLARRIYDIPEPLLPAAERNVLAHLIALHHVGAVDTQEEIARDSFFAAT
ncbi:MBL fold metallo-hydrolase [Paracoccus sp. 1_MG-2023]|uniref:MBL fold metallo-hydrolase n=1 Tax=unclassified Paracoccus (in: a-proteobacteria) TaxID=2688777 RepID=UPI001C09A8F6|nr:MULTISPECIES: MBL fold metallo-hydrolase [unclassified Paracoccus (in: a-proteobacteria)]MBU2958983.1 MBL fold metallo-hydrolase [Paracoccus sp. C2R09]MDO6668955.1 MBL fold metallo-hydrolase [Paracoccus sp. 1_MG-2023]